MAGKANTYKLASKLVPYARNIANQFGVEVGGWRATGSTKTSDHPKGLALDAMVGKDTAKGDLIAKYAQTLPDVKYIIFNNRSWNPKTGEWKPYTHPSGVRDARLNHEDHVHVSFTGQPSSPGNASPTSQAASPGPSIDAVLATLRKRESGGKYDQPGSHLGGDASGAYQFRDATWKGLAGSQLAKQYPRAYMAPPEVQDQVARKHVQQILDANKGDVRAVPAYWFYPAGAKQALAGKDVQPPSPKGGGKNPSMLTYINGFMSEYGKVAGAQGFGTSVVGGIKDAATGAVAGSRAPFEFMAPPPMGSPFELPKMGDYSQMQQAFSAPPPTQSPLAGLNLALGQNAAPGGPGKMRVLFDPATGQIVTRSA